MAACSFGCIVQCNGNPSQCVKMGEAQIVPTLTLGRVMSNVLTMLENLPYEQVVEYYNTLAELSDKSKVTYLYPKGRDEAVFIEIDGAESRS